MEFSAVVRCSAIRLQHAHGIEPIAIALALQRIVCRSMFALGCYRRAHSERSKNHDERTNDDQQPVSRVRMRQFSKNERTPRKAPQLVRVRQRNAAPNAQILGRILLKDVADHPDKAAQKKPEQHGPRLRRGNDRDRRCAIERERQRKDGAEFPIVKTVTKESGFIPLM